MPIVYHFITQELKAQDSNLTPSVDPDVCAILESYPWPGNIRELENAIKHAITFAKDGKITKETLPPKIAATPVKATHQAGGEQFDSNRCKSLKAFLRAKEKEYLNQVLVGSEGDKEKAAKALKISLATLYRKLPEKEE